MKIGFKILFFSIAYLFQHTVYAEIPKGYYDAIEGKKDRELKTALSQILVNHTVLSYNSLWYYFRTTDARSDGRTVWDMYSNTTRNFNGNNSVSGMNREHSLPKSWWAVADQVDKYDAYSDLNHLYPSDGEANMAKSNYILGEIGSSISYNNGVSKTGINTFSGGPSRNAFEPDDMYKGDFARTYFYMVTCYEQYASQWRSDGVYMLDNNTYPVFEPWAVNMLLKWHRDDPVSEKEINRNNEVFRYQGNRNPFIDFPQMAEYVWGDSIGYNFLLPEDQKPQIPVLITPQNLTELYMGEVQPDQTVSLTVPVKGVDLTGSLSIFPYGTNRNHFSVSATSIPANLANRENGYELTVSYTPAEYGEHTADLSIYDGGMRGSIAVKLIGVCSESSDLVPIGAQSPDLFTKGYTIQFRTYQPGSSYTIYTIQGQILQTGKGSGEWQSYTVPVQGIYIIQINGKRHKAIINGK